MLRVTFTKGERSYSSDVISMDYVTEYVSILGKYLGTPFTVKVDEIEEGD